MKNFLKIIAFVGATAFFMQSCGVNKVIVNREVETKDGDKMLLGTQTKNQLLNTPYSDWYSPEHDEYQMDKKSIDELKKEKLKSYNIVVVMGTWCSDSHREVPRLMKILEEIKYPENKLTLIAVNRKKESPSGEEGIYNIQKVPTIIVKKYGKEIGRIVESPNSGWLERDLLDIIKKDDKSIKTLFK